jgi:hypothetical protein
MHPQAGHFMSKLDAIIIAIDFRNMVRRKMHGHTENAKQARLIDIAT